MVEMPLRSFRSRPCLVGRTRILAIAERAFVLALLVLGALGLGGFATGCSRAADAVALASDHPDARAFLAAHNAVRASIAPASGPPLPPLVWSNALAKQAARAAADCSLDHSRTDFGENIAAAAPALSPAEAVAIWTGERSDWSPSTNRCRPGRVCGHYTQLVWRATRAIGCATRRCENGALGTRGPWILAVCQYDPGGNHRGVPPY